MSTAKKIITNAIEGIGEIVKEGASQVVETIDPTKMIDSAIGVKHNESEFTKYLKGLGGDATQADIEKRKKEFEEQKSKELVEAQKVISNALPAHLRPTRQVEQSIFEKNKQEDEMKKAQMIEAQKKQQSQALSDPTSKVTGPAARRRKKSTGTNFEAQKNIKVG